MKHHIFKKIILAGAMLMSVANVLAQTSDGERPKKDSTERTGSASREFMKVAPYRVKVNDKLCYMVKIGYSRWHNDKWELYCGVISNFYYQDGYDYALYVDKYDISSDTILNIKTLASSGVPDLRLRAAWLKFKSKNDGKLFRVIKLSDEKIQIDDKLCYQVAEYSSKRDTSSKWTPFCGELNFTGDVSLSYGDVRSLSYDSLISLSKEDTFPLPFPVVLFVEDYDSDADTINVIGMVGDWPFCSVKDRNCALSDFKSKKDAKKRGRKRRKSS
jgi:hypothetical protein